MFNDKAKQKLLTRLYDKGVQNINDRPLTAKIQLRGGTKQITEKLPTIVEKNRSYSQNQTSMQQRGQTPEDRQQSFQQTFFLDTTNGQIQLDERRLNKSKQVQELMDKMIGKKKVERLPTPRQSRQKTQVLPKIEELDHSKQQIQQSRQQIRNESQKSLESDDDDVGVLNLKDVDTFISMIKENRLHQLEFMYLIKNKNNNNDSYNMKAVSFGHIDKHKIQNYYTLSAQGLTRYQNNVIKEFIKLGDWLNERKQFNAIKGLSFFRKFRMWKTLKKWGKILHQQKVEIISQELKEKMPILRENYRLLLLNHRFLCYDIESSRIVKSTDMECKSLNDFVNAQQIQQREITHKLKLQSDKMRSNCNEYLKSVIEILKKDINEEENAQETKGFQQKPTGKIDKKKEVLKKMGFPENMSYGHRAKMRQEFLKFLRIAYLLDFMAVESLGRVYINSCQEFLAKFIKIQESCKIERKLPYPSIKQEGEESSRYKEVQEIEPIFLMELKWMRQQKDLEITIEQVEIEYLNENILEFDLERNMKFKEIQQVEKQEKNDKNEKGKQTKKEEQEESVSDFTSKRVVENLYQVNLMLEPTQKEFLNKLQETFNEGLDSIQVITRWSKHPDFNDYVMALEEWDEIIGEKWTKPDSDKLNPSYWIKDHSFSKIFIPKIYENMDQAFYKLQLFQKELNDYLNLVWVQENSDLSKLSNPLLEQKSRIFQQTLKQGLMVDKILKSNLVPTVDMGIFRVKLEAVQKYLLLKQQNLLQKYEEIYIQIFRQNASQLKIWLQQSTKSLSGMVIKIEEFIEQKNSVDRITRELPGKREEIEIMVQLLSLMQEEGLNSVKKEDKDLSQELNFHEGSLNVALSEADNNTAKNIERFKKTLKERIDKLKAESVDISESVQKEKYLLLQTPIQDAINELSELDVKLKAMENLAAKYTEYEEILQCQEQASYDLLENTREQLNLKLSMWVGIQEFRQLSLEWTQLPFNKIQAKEMAQKTEGYMRIVSRCEKNLNDNKVVQYLKKIVWEFKDTIPVVTALRSQYLTPIHWAEIKALVRTEFDVNNNEFTLNKLLDMNVAQHVEFITEISIKAAQEDALQNQLKAVETQWSEIDLKLKPYKDSVDTMVLGEVEELIQQFDEGLANMSNILASRYIKPLRPKAEKMQGDLLLLSDIIDKWVECQKKWIYLESIFSSPDIKKQLPNESQQFDGCDKLIKKLVKQVNMRPQIMKLLAIPNLLDNLSKTFDTLEIIEKSLEEYLEVKRTSFPRFYFLSNEELLEILAKQNDIEAVQQNLQKCFEAAVRLFINEQSPIIQGIFSPEGEQIIFYKQIPARGNVEIWLRQVEIEMIETLRKLTKTGMQDYLNGVQKTRNDWILTHKSQIVSTVSQILWSVNSEDAINESSVKPNSLYEWHDLIVMQLSQLTMLVRGDLSSIQRKTIVALITTDVHNRDIIQKLSDNQVETPFDFLWQQQLRYYWDDESDDCIVKQVTSVFHYGYEYLGATSRLVITPLTDRCWITITSALANQLGAAPAGPAGTGKTESTKDLAKALGRYCIVFNCSDQITAAMMNKLFSGLIQQGAWTCLDEFNRIDIEVLSVIAQQLLSIRMALLQKQDEFQFDGRTIPIKNTYGVFITMNPGYAGRTELPDNLKSLFRPVAMMIPDYKLIAEIMLYAEGFENASDLSSKMVQLYKLSSQQLSQQDHYDFGMRAVKSLLVMAGSLKRQDIQQSEDVVLIRAMRDANVPKFLKDDLPLFNALIQDLFPSVSIPNIKQEDLEKQLQVNAIELNLQIIDAFINKTVQLNDTINVRFGSMIVGSSGAGKTRCYQLLAETLPNIKYYILNPKSIDMGELYGEVDLFTNEWQDGLASSIIRECNNSKDEFKYWIIFDGPVDALWIENMNSVLDDSMTLCLANSERIKLRSELRMIFEVQDLSVASPATVSRCGMVYMSAEELHWSAYFESWMERTFNNHEEKKLKSCHQIRHKTTQQIKLEQKYKDQIRNLFKTQYSILDERSQSFEEPFQTISLQKIANVCNIMEKYLKEIQDIKEDLSKRIQIIFLYSLIWGYSISFEQKHYDKVLKHLFSYKKSCSDFQPPTYIKLCYRIRLRYLHIQFLMYFMTYEVSFHKSKVQGYIIIIQIYKIIFINIIYFQISIIIKDLFQSVLFPKCDTVFDFFIDQDYNINSWEGQLADFEFSKDQPYFSLMVPTIDSLKFSHIIQMHTQMQKPVLLCGQTGVGKSMMVQTLLKNMKSDGVQSILLNFSAQTKARQTQLAIEGKLNKKGKTLFGARANESIVIFIDDINMPALEQYGAQPCIELLRLMLELGGFYDRQKLFWKNIEDTSLICAAGPPGGGRNKLSQRFVRKFNVLNVPVQNDSILLNVYGSILKGYLNSINFTEQVRKLCEPITKTTIDLFRKISTDLLPIPSKFHYTFNPRDISKVFQGLLMVKPISANNPDQFIRLWVHETSRVFCDRLISRTDKIWFFDTIKELLARQFTINKDEISPSILFSDILKLESTNILYEEVSEKRKVIVNALIDKLEDYVMSTNDKVELVFFDDALEHVLRISRIFRQLRGNAMLIGVGGSGKQSLAKLSSFLMKCDIVQIEIVKNYNQDAFRADLQKMLMKAGVDREQVSFIFTENQIVYESFLEDVNNLLNTGEVPNLFQKKEEFDAIYQGLRPVFTKLKKVETPEALWTFFIEEIRNNLHIVLCMSPVGDLLRVRSRKFPSLINCCTLDWFQPWPKQALLEVAQSFLEKCNIPQQDQLSMMCTEVSISVQELCEKFYKELRRQVYTTPKSYLDQIKLYCALYKNKLNEYQLIQKKLSDGLDKLFKANETVAILKVEMEEMQPQLLEQQVKTEQFLKQLAIDQGEANMKERLVNDEAQIVNQQAFEIKLIADEAQSELNKALPAMREAEEALQKISKADIAEVKGFINPSPIVIMVLEAVCILLGEKTDWNSAKSVMVSNDFMDRLVKFDRNSIQDQTLRKLRQITNKPEFEPIFVGQRSLACKSLCIWCRAIDNYAKIAKDVEPKKKKVAEMQMKLDLKNQELQIKQEELQKLRDKVAKLQKECDETIEKKNILEKDIMKTQKRLLAAEKLTFLLADEGIRWKEYIKQLEKQIRQVVGDVFLAASTISYLGAFTGPYREGIIKEWKQRLKELEIPLSDNYQISTTLETLINIRDWVGEGLPNDAISIDNAVIATKCERWPLMIDPQGQANKWLKQHNKEIKVVRFTETHYLKILQQCIGSGYEVLFEEVDQTLEPSIDSVLQKQIIEVDGRKLIKIGDQRVDYNPTFKLYLTSKIANPNYLPEVYIKVTVINFSITFEGLQDQLLGEVMKFEKEEIEKQRGEVIIKMSNSNKQLKQAQDAILDLLANAEGMILDNEQLINTLENSKQQSIDIQRSLKETEILEKQINESRNLYLSVSIRGTVLYFVIQDMSNIDPMYQYSLQYFKKLFQLSLQQAQQSELLQERLQNLENTVTQIVYKDVCRGLFEQHKRVYSFLICTSIQRQNGNISPYAWNLLIRNQVPQNPIPNPDRVFFKETQWNLILSSQEQIIELSDLASDLKNNLLFWREYAQNEDLYNASFPLQSPLSTSHNFNPFLKLILIKALKPEKLVNSFICFVDNQLGEFYNDVTTSNMDAIYQSSDCYTPIIFILSPGADPTQSLLKLSSEYNTNLNIISLGQGQGKKAELMMAKNQKDGQWILLQNCHLAKSWMGQLELLIEQLTSKQLEVNQNFRIFLTSMPASYFPVSTLQNGIKLTTEPPRGLKANLKRSYQELPQDINTKIYRQMIFCLSFFHAIIQERRKFGPLGFNKAYEFNDSDHSISLQMIKMFVSSEDDIPWDAIQFMIGQINYGGRVTDDQDRTCLTSILRKYIGDHIEEKAKFSESGIYYVPFDGELDVYTQYIESLPNQEDPEVFGMHQNANIVFQSQESRKFLDIILAIQPRISSQGDGMSPDQIVMDKSQQFITQLPELIDKAQCHPRHNFITENGSIQSLSTVLFQEIDKYNKLLQLMQVSLIQIQQAIKGFAIMSSDLDVMYLSFLNNQIPPIWMQKSYATLKPLASWFKDLLLRVQTIKNWMEREWVPAYWMSGLFYPQGFLTGVLQTHSRRYKIPINKLNFKFKILELEVDRIKEEPKDGVYVQGLFLEGARWDASHDTLIDQALGQLYYPLQIVYFQPQEEYNPPDDYYSCPCYKTSNRIGVLSTTGQSTNYILSIDLPSRGERPEFWTLRGTAIISQLND